MGGEIVCTESGQTIELWWTGSGEVSVEFANDTSSVLMTPATAKELALKLMLVVLKESK